jgi:hypothetical protein
VYRMTSRSVSQTKQKHYSSVKPALLKPNRKGKRAFCIPLPIQ